MSDNDWLTNIDNLTTAISAALGSEVVSFLFKRYGSSGLNDLPHSYYSEVFAELQHLYCEI